MARIVIVGGGFGGVVAAQTLVQRLRDEHQITLISRNHRFLFYPALVRLSFGECSPDDVSFDLRRSMLHRRVNFIEAEVAYIDPDENRIVIAHGEVEGNIAFDYLIFALGRRLATERVSGFFEHAHHLLNLDAALKFGEAVRKLGDGPVVLGQCAGARLPVPVYETAFALSRSFKKNGTRGRFGITIVSPENLPAEFGDEKMAATLSRTLMEEQIEYVPNFSVKEIKSNHLIATDSRSLTPNLLMLVPPFRGSSAAARLGATDAHGYINVDSTMRVVGLERIYAVGDCVSFGGPKLGHMAVRQAEVAAANVAAQITGEGAPSHYEHNLTMILETGDGDSIYFQKDLWSDEPSSVRQGRFWSWAKRVHQKYWKATHA
jgi:sulfide:quinone oxidoreductase